LSRQEIHGEERHIDMRALTAGLVIVLGIVETAMSATALYAERPDVRPPTMGPEVRTDREQRRGNTRDSPV